MEENKIKINLVDSEQFNYEYIVQNRIIKLFQEKDKIIIGKDHSVAKSLINEIKYLFRNYKVEFTELNQKEFDDLLREISKNENHYSKDEKSGITNKDDLNKLASDAPIVNLVNEIIISGIEKKATDVHFEAFETYFRVRLRIDGFLTTTGTYSANLYEAVCARIKVISKLDVTQRRLAQDGKASLSLYGKKLDIRVSTMPTIFGESVVLRFLEHKEGFLQLEALGFIKEDIEICRRIIQKSYGAFVITGPTGSGKTTTLRAILSNLDSKTRNIITIEDPVEYTIEGINQIQISEKIGFTFDTVLRNILRQDPDVIMIGEMRDYETADLALKSAMTGHFVLSSLHTNDAISSITRLLNIGIAPYILESSLVGAAAQRLIRVLCDKCKEEHKPTKIEKEIFEKYKINLTSLYKPVGCPDCNNTGFVGRKAMFEIFEIDETIKEMIIKNDSVTNMRNHLFNNGFSSMFKKALIEASKGNVFVEEVLSIIGEIK
ncbi:MAG: hypothetical protein A2Y34_06765 [Spirochaetes bacterium GWC1_27_15]|nr:MAG: hypothetical protein A2Z98_14260 [Spirochaetes bacterium GWB1_27_13]OHD22498.1 MAG: hypothetical protein A2Y34_06765 [Spirochaetes bacterium GWC1_27_15]